MYRNESKPKSRVIEFRHTIDPGFVNRRLVQTVLPDRGMELVDELISQIPDMPEGLREVRVDHAYSQVAMKFCEVLPAPTLGQLLAKGNGHFFCSTEEFNPCPAVYDQPRVQSTIAPAGNSNYSVTLEYSTEHVRSSTLRTELHNGATLSVVAIFRRMDGDTLLFHPLVMGAPWMSHEDEHIST